MTRIEFYILTADCANDRLDFLDGLLQKQLSHDKPIHIYCCSAKSATYTRSRYHSYMHADQRMLSVCHSSEPNPNARVLVNLAPEVPWFFSRFDKTIEIIDANEQTRLLGRERYLFYRERGYPLKHFNIDLNIDSRKHPNYPQTNLQLAPA